MIGEKEPVTGRGVKIEHNVPISTWFRIGGKADRFARPTDLPQLRECVKIDPALRVLGDGANLLVDDEGVGELVVELSASAFKSVAFDGKSGVVRAGAGAKLPQLINESVRLGLSGLHVLGGIPATVGGALVMNAGGAFGQIADCVVRVHALDRKGREVTLERAKIKFDYRHSGLGGLIVHAAEFQLTPGDRATLRTRHLEVMKYKKDTQPMADNSAGCAFKNPTLREDAKGLGKAGERLGAGLLIDRAGCKGLSVGGATVSPRHGNFLVTGPDAKARDVIGLMALVTQRVVDAFGIALEPEVVVWRRRP